VGARACAQALKAKCATGGYPAAHWRLRSTQRLRQAVTLMDARLAGKIELVTLPSVGATVGIIILHVEGKVVEGLVSRDRGTTRLRSPNRPLAPGSTSRQ
jgi:hypothetical protein